MTSPTTLPRLRHRPSSDQASDTTALVSPGPEKNEEHDEEGLKPPPNAFIRHPVLTYLQFIVPLFLVSVGCLSFVAYLATYGRVAAPEWLADASTSSPRVTAQVVTLFATSLTATTRWALGGAATLLARKRFYQQYRPIFEIEHWSALRNIGMIWDWTHRKRTMFLTWLLVATCGLLTSGFVALIAPFPVAKQTALSGFYEVDLNSSSPKCMEWHDNARAMLFTETSEATVLNCNTSMVYKSFSFSSCGSDSEGLQAARASLLGHFSLQAPFDKRASYVTAFATFNNTRFLGSTSGTIPTGPAGIQIYDYPKTPPTARGFNYTLDLQGLWADVSCEYNLKPSVNFSYTGTFQGADPLVFNLICPSGRVAYPPSHTPVPNAYLRNKLLVAYYCTDTTDGSSDLYFNVFDRLGEPMFNAMDFVQCRVTPRIGNVRTVLYSEYGGFRTFKGPYINQTINNFTSVIADEAMWGFVSDINHSQSEWTGNSWAMVVRWLASTMGGLSMHGKQDPAFLPLIEKVVAGMFEYSSSRYRLLLSLAAGDEYPLPPECHREVTGVMTERMVGWNLQPTTLIALIPLLFVIIISAGMIGRTLLMHGRLTRFDPTSAVSLVASTSAGAVYFPDDPSTHNDDIVGDPLDKVVGETKVAYVFHEGRWGLKTE